MNLIFMSSLQCPPIPEGTAPQDHQVHQVLLDFQDHKDLKVNLSKHRDL